MDYTVKRIGTVRSGRSFAVELDAGYSAGLTGLLGFSHVVILWYADKAPVWDSSFQLVDKPYRLAPEKVGIFATRSPLRPSRICVSVAELMSVNEKKGLVNLRWTDAEDGTPVLDLKPYHPSSDRIRDASVPSWCAHWPLSYEESAGFDWEKEFLF
jgi:tRNA (Thr-GGU) A37 N-methylase